MYKKLKQIALGSVLFAGVICPVFSDVGFTVLPVENTRPGGDNRWMQVSDNGVVTFMLVNNTGNRDGYTWSTANGLTKIHQGEPLSKFVEISNDGQVTTYADYVYQNGQLVLETPVDVNVRSLSPDGENIGTYTNGANRYPGVLNIESGVLETFDDPALYDYLTADFSNDSKVKLLSSVVINFNDPSPFYLMNSTGGYDEIDRRYGSVADLSGDGKTVVGKSYFCSDSSSCTVITNLLGSVEISATFAPQGLNYDGSVAVGAQATYPNGIYGGTVWVGAIWDETNGIRDIADVLAANGIDFSGWDNINLYDISDNGYYIIGEGYNSEGNRQPFLIDSAPQCSVGGVY